MVFGGRKTDANARAHKQLVDMHTASNFQSTRGVIGRVTVCARCTEGLTYFSGPREEIRGVFALVSSLKHYVFSFEGEGAANQYAGPHTLLICGDIHEVVNAVAEVDVRMSWWAPKRRISFGFAAIAVTCGVSVIIGFDFGDLEGDGAVNDGCANEIVGDLEGRTRVERLGQDGVVGVGHYSAQEKRPNGVGRGEV